MSATSQSRQRRADGKSGHVRYTAHHAAARSALATPAQRPSSHYPATAVRRLRFVPWRARLHTGSSSRFSRTELRPILGLHHRSQILRPLRVMKPVTAQPLRSPTQKPAAHFCGRVSGGAIDFEQDTLFHWTSQTTTKQFCTGCAKDRPSKRDPAVDINGLPIHLALSAGMRSPQLARNSVRDRFRLADEHAVAVPADFERTRLVRC